MEFLITINLIATGMLFLWMLSRSGTIDDDANLQSQISGIQSQVDKSLHIAKQSLKVYKKVLDKLDEHRVITQNTFNELVQASNGNHDVIKMILDELGLEFVAVEKIDEVKPAHLKKVTKKKK